MMNPLRTLQDRKNRIRSVLATTDETISQCNIPMLRESWKSSEGDRLFPSILRGFLIDERTIRAVSLKVKMLLTLLMKAQELWMSRQEVRDLLPCPYGGWLPETVQSWDSTLFLKIGMAPFIYQDYIQPSVKFLSIRGDGVNPGFVSHQGLSKSQLALWGHLGIDTATCSSLDPMNFFAEQLAPWLQTENAGASPFALLFDEQSGEGERRAILELSSYLGERGIETELAGIHSAVEMPALSAVLSTVPAATLAGLEPPMPAALRSLLEKGRLFNMAPLPVFAQGIFELLTDPCYTEALGAPPIETVKRMLPWTRIIRDGEITTPAGQRASLRDYARTARQYLVLRPQWGEDVDALAGSEMTDDEWVQTVESALSRPCNYVLQEKVEYPSASLPFVEGDEVQWRKALFTIDMFASSRGDIGGMAADVYTLDDSMDIMSSSPFSSEYLGFTSVMKAEL